MSGMGNCWRQRKAMNYEAFLMTKMKEDVPTGFSIDAADLNPMLYDFQGDAVRWALRRGRSAVFFDCGLGKTPLQLEWAKHVSLYTGKPVLIFAPLAVSMQTKREGEKFGINVKICKEAADMAGGVNVTNYQRLERFDLGQFGGIVLDESSILRSFSGKFRNMIIDMSQQVPFKLCCTATPVPNDYMELGNHSEFLNVMTRSEMLATFFVHDSSETQKWRLKGHALDVFWQWLASWAVMMRNPSDMGYDGCRFQLPPLKFQEHIVRSEVPPDGMLFPVEAVTLEEQRAAKRATIKLRAAALADIINGSKEQWLVWCSLNDESKELTSILDGAVEVKGSDSIEHKENSMLDFAKGEIPVLVTKPSIAGHGMNWQNCHNMAFVGLSHSWESFYQATRRCWRFGQTKPVNAHIVISDMEMRIVRNIQRKEGQFKEMYTGMLKNSNEYMRDQMKGVDRMNEQYASDQIEYGSWKLIHGDCIEEMKGIADRSLDFSVFSPPFSSLYVYSASERDMGNSTDAQFMEHYRFFTSELYRIMLEGRMVAIHCSDIPAMKERDGYIGLKDLPGMLRQCMEDAGFIYYGRITIWKDPVVEVTRTKSLPLLHKQLKKDGARCRVGLPDYVLLCRKPGENLKPVIHTDENFPVPEWQEIASPVWMNIKQGDVLRKEKDDKDERHICPLQLGVIRRLVRLYTNEGDLVFSPFAGIGSEGYVAITMGRKFLGIELKRSYFDQAVENLHQATREVDQDMLL